MKSISHIADYLSRVPRKTADKPELASTDIGKLHQDLFPLVEAIGVRVARLLERAELVEPHDRLYEVRELPGTPSVRFTHIPERSLRKNKVDPGPFYQRRSGIFVPFKLSLELPNTYSVPTETQDRERLRAYLEQVQGIMADQDETSSLDLLDLQGFIREFNRRKSIKVENFNLSNHRLIRNGRTHSLDFDFSLEAMGEETTIEWIQSRTLAHTDINFSLEGDYDLNVDTELWPGDLSLDSPTLHTSARKILKKIHRALERWKAPKEVEK